VKTNVAWLEYFTSIILSKVQYRSSLISLCIFNWHGNTLRNLLPFKPFLLENDSVPPNPLPRVFKVPRGSKSLQFT